MLPCYKSCNCRTPVQYKYSIWFIKTIHVSLPLVSSYPHGSLAVRQSLLISNEVFSNHGNARAALQHAVGRVGNGVTHHRHGILSSTDSLYCCSGDQIIPCRRSRTRQKHVHRTWFAVSALSRKYRVRWAQTGSCWCHATEATIWVLIVVNGVHYLNEILQRIVNQCSWSEPAVMWSV